MSNTQPLLEGRIVSESETEFLNALRPAEKQIVELHREVKEIREQLSDIQGVFAALRVVLSSENGRPSAVVGANPVWEDLKRKLGGKQAEVIDSLQKLGAMSRGELRAATQSGWSTVDAVIAKLRDQGIISKRNGKWSLKEL